MSVSELSTSTQNYLKAIWHLQEWQADPVPPSALAQRLGLRPSTVSDALRKLAEQGLVDHTPYGTVSFTDAGRRYAIEMVRRHRLIETFLVRVLHYSWDEVHDEAEHLEHAVSDKLINRLDELLGNPKRDPHGDPIPAPDGTLSLPDARLLAQFQPGAKVTVERVSDDNPELLQYLKQRSIDIGDTFTLEAGAPFSEVILAVAADGTATPLGSHAQSQIWVSAHSGVAGASDPGSGSAV